MLPHALVGSGLQVPSNFLGHRDVMQGKRNGSAVKILKEGLFLNGSQCGKVSPAPVALLGRQKRSAGKGPVIVDPAGAVLSDERAQTGFSPMQPEIRLHVTGTGAKLPEALDVPGQSMLLYSRELTGCRHSFRKSGIDCQGAATTATATTVDFFTCD